MSLILRILNEGDYMPGRSSRIILFVILGLFLTLFFLPQFISFYVDWLWFKDVRFEKIFITKINAQAITATGRNAGRFSHHLPEHLIFDAGHEGQDCCYDCI